MKKLSRRTLAGRSPYKAHLFAWCLLLFALPGLAMGAPKSTTNEPPPKNEAIVPKGAWVLESVSVTVAAVGFVVLAIGATTLGRRDQIISEYENPSGFGSVPERPKATEIKEMQDMGSGFLISGLIVAGVGVAGMIAGGIWILAHRPKGDAKASVKVSQNNPRPAPLPSSQRPAKVLLQTP